MYMSLELQIENTFSFIRKYIFKSPESERFFAGFYFAKKKKKTQESNPAEFFFWKSKTIFFIFWPPSVQGRSIEAIRRPWAASRPTCDCRRLRGGPSTRRTAAFLVAEVAFGMKALRKTDRRSEQARSLKPS
jgi:hypothetical protein